VQQQTATGGEVITRLDPKSVEAAINA